MQGQQDFDARVQEIVAHLRESLHGIRRSVDGTQDGNVVELVEAGITQLKKTLGGKCQQALMSHQVTNRDREACTCQCGSRMAIKDRRWRSVYGVHGQFRVRRRYFICPQCKAKALPLDEAMKLTRFTGKLVEAANLLDVTHSSREGAYILEKLTGVQIAHSTLHKLTVAAGEQLQAAKETTLVGDRVARNTDVAYLSADGVHVNTTEGWREMKLGCVFDECHSVRHYLATFESCEPFGEKWRDLARLADVKQARTVIAVADGAAWIWEQVRTRFPFADIEIVDFYHAAENIAKAATEIYGEGTRQAEKWLGKKRHILRYKGGRALIRSLTGSRRYRKQDPAMVRLVKYLRSHRDRIEYPAYRRHGYDIGSGLIESSCKNVVQARLKGPGMRWNAQKATAIANLRALLISGYWEDFQQMRRAG